VDPSADHAADIVYRFGLGLWRGRTKIRVDTTKYIWPFIINRVIDVSWIALTLCFTSWTNLWRDPELASFPGRLTMVDGICGEGTECRVHCINQ
jgi:hypothetical protein